jgi:uncharacterized protein (TIGR02996 family)
MDRTIDALLAAVAEAPKDTATALVAADALEDANDPRAARLREAALAGGRLPPDVVIPGIKTLLQAWSEERLRERRAAWATPSMPF